jgi:hypothetical protein
VTTIRQTGKLGYLGFLAFSLMLARNALSFAGTYRTATFKAPCSKLPNPAGTPRCGGQGPSGKQKQGGESKMPSLRTPYIFGSNIELSRDSWYFSRAQLDGDTRDTSCSRLELQYTLG